MAEAQGSTFKINARRPNKHFPDQHGSESGTWRICFTELPEFKVDVHQPDVLLNIELRNEGAYLYHKEIRVLGVCQWARQQGNASAQVESTAQLPAI